MNSPKISVIIPCYNQGKFIDEAVDSVLNQTYQDFEIIIINDGSTDDFTNEKLKNYNKPKSKVIQTENHGLSAARNSGYRVAKGEFIQFLDADDVIQPTKFEEQILVFSKLPETEICYTDFQLFDIDKNEFLILPEKEFLGEDPLYDFLFRWERGLSIPIHCALFKKSLWYQKLPFNEELNAKEDWLMWCGLAVQNKYFYYLDRELAIYRFHEDNMTKNIVEMNHAFFLSVFYILQIIPERFKKEFLKEAIVHVNKTLEINLYPNLVIERIDLKNKFNEMDKTIDYKIGHLLMKPYRYFKTKIFGKKYL